MAIQNALNATFSSEIDIRFETTPELISGIELTTNGQKVAWSISDYLAALGKSVDELLIEKDKTAADAKAKTESNMTVKIGKRAYELYEMQGRKEGQAVQNWDAAEREIRSGIPGSNKVDPIAVARVEPKPEVKPNIETKTNTESEAATATDTVVNAEPKLATKAQPEATSKHT